MSQATTSSTQSSSATDESDSASKTTSQGTSATTHSETETKDEAKGAENDEGKDKVKEEDEDEEKKKKKKSDNEETDKAKDSDTVAATDITFSFDWIRDNIKSHLAEKDFEDTGSDDEKLGNDKVVREYARQQLIRASGVMAYVDNLEAKVRELSNPSKGDKKKEEEKNKPKWIPEIERRRQITDEFGDTREISEGEADTSLDKGAGGHIVKFIRHFDGRKQHTKSLIKIISPQLRLALRNVIHQGSTELLQSLVTSEEITMEEPYMPLFYHRKALMEHAETLDEESKKQVEVLLKFMEEDYPEAYKMQDLIDSDEAKSIDMGVLWLLYSPKSIVYTKVKDDWVALEVDSVEGAQRYGEEKQPLALNLCSMEFREESKELERLITTKVVPFYTDKMPIEKLKFVPEKYLPDKDKIRKDLVARGKKYNEFAEGPKYLQYVGDAWPQMDSKAPLRVMIDITVPAERKKPKKEDEDEKRRKDGDEEDRSYVEGCSCTSCTKTRRRRKLKEWLRRAKSEGVNDDDLSDDDYILCPPTIWAYSLRIKSYEEVEIRNLHDVVYESNAWSNLVVPKSYKKLVTSMVESYGDKGMMTKDLVRGKGQGLVILLHGDPGTGKTLTAECMAEQQKRPLFMITSGDLGVQAEVLEQKLRDAFLKATKWNAILLLDEADVFLQWRDIKDLKRNALVSVFLREIEYFDGILFLTTNRPGLLDEAFQSRIHLTLFMRPLEMKGQLKVWRLFLFKGRTELDAEEKKLLGRISELTKDMNLNGREIRNHVMTASALRLSEGLPAVTEEQIIQVLDTAREFTEYLDRLNAQDQKAKSAMLGYSAPSLPQSRK